MKAIKGTWNWLFASQPLEISDADYQWLLANPDKVGDYVIARIILG